jgi:hypothetical protein
VPLLEVTGMSRRHNVFALGWKRGWKAREGKEVTTVLAFNCLQPRSKGIEGFVGTNGYQRKETGTKRSQLVGSYIVYIVRK